MQVHAEESKQGEKEQAGKDKDPVNKGGNAYIDELPVSVEVACYILRIWEIFHFTPIITRSISFLILLIRHADKQDFVYAAYSQERGVPGKGGLGNLLVFQVKRSIAIYDFEQAAAATLLVVLSTNGLLTWCYSFSVFLLCFFGPVHIRSTLLSPFLDCNVDSEKLLLQEMKKKLRDEYLGFGGAPNQVSGKEQPQC